MASLPGPMSLPDPKAKNKPAKVKIDIPYNRPEQRIRRAIKSFIAITLVLSVVSILVIFASNGDVEMNLVLSAVSSVFGFIITLAMYIVPLIMTYGALLWFLGRPKVEVIRPGDDTSVTFADYWGQPQLVKLVKQWMSLLRDRKEFEKMGGKYISGLLLFGPPGTGKTMLAKAIAGESGMAFIAAEGSGFMGTFVGTDVIKVLQFAGKARALARQYGACVAYIDEIDAIGTSRSGMGGGAGGMGMRGGGMFGGMGMMGLSTLLSQMDGMNNLSRGEKINRNIYKLFGRRYTPKRNWHVMWMGSTNRPEVLDPALTRSGRLDTKIAVDPPDRASRRLIIQGYLSKIQADETVDVEAIVADTNGATPADINGAITKDAVRIAFFDGRKKVSQKDIDKAFMEQHAGMEMPIEEFDEGQRRVLAYHEAGHAVAQYYMMPDQKIVRTTIVRLSTGSYGHMQPIDTVEQHIMPVKTLAYEIIVYMAGRESEKLYAGEMFQSVGGDYPGIRYMMWRLIENGFFGPPLAGGDQGPMGNSYNQYLRGERNDESTLKKYWLTMEDMTSKLLRRHWKEVTAVAEELLLKNTLSGKEVVEVMESHQSADSLREEEIIPRTLAAIRAQALAEIRSGRSGGALLSEPIPVTNEVEMMSRAPNSEEVIVINGGSNGSASAQPQQPAPSNGSSSSGPTLVNDGGGYTPEVLNGNAAPPPAEEQK